MTDNVLSPLVLVLSYIKSRDCPDTRQVE